ncbi:hypothetical protein NDU88_008457 [Pleurodeles waltl]|uniref:Uncharacterized protein n=1 Tax=Pleurodeles waltl TaxID=8319 RepID=A0AAV7RXP4_PLEWA|nr:hypothetical protein NDU88_008457 [Pleurodeles waltl]
MFLYLARLLALFSIELRISRNDGIILLSNSAVRCVHGNLIWTGVSDYGLFWPGSRQPQLSAPQQDSPVKAPGHADVGYDRPSPAAAEHNSAGPSSKGNWAP